MNLRTLAARLAGIGCGALLAFCLFAAAAQGSGAAQAGGAAHAPSAGCGRTAQRGVLQLGAQDGAGRARSFVAEVPADYAAAKPYALVFVFHGAAGNAAQSRSWGLQKAVGAAANGIFVFPNGIEFQHYGVGWDDTRDGYDLPFFDHMVHTLEAAYCIDRDRLFVAGFSWGGDFAIALACNRGDVIDAVAANSTDDEFKDVHDYRTYQDLPCPTRRHPRLRFVHAVDGDSQYPPPDFATTSKLLRYLNSCDARSMPVTSSTSVMTCAAFSECSSEYVECSFDHGIGHTLPPHWAQDTWDFFSKQ